MSTFRKAHVALSNLGVKGHSFPSPLTMGKSGGMSSPIIIGSACARELNITIASFAVIRTYHRGP